MRPYILIALLAVIYLVGYFGIGGMKDYKASAPLTSICASGHEALNEFSTLLQDVHEKQKNVGVAAAAHLNGNLLYQDYLGLSDLEHHVPVGAETIFGIASITKLFTAVIILKLVEQGLLDLDAPIQTYVPTFPEKPEGVITPRMLITHQSGIPHPGSEKRTPELFATHYETATQALEVFKDDSLAFTPGSDAAYSSSGYNLLAAAVEGITGKPFPIAVEDEILRPLRLFQTSFSNVLHPQINIARKYSYYHPRTYAESDVIFVVPTWDYSFNPGGGNMVSTVRDLNTFGDQLLRPGFLSEDSYALLVEWFGNQDESGNLYLYASGGNPGLQAGLAIYPQLGFTSSVLSNTWGIGSNSQEMILLTQRFAQVCLPDHFSVSVNKLGISLSR